MKYSYHIKNTNLCHHILNLDKIPHTNMISNSFKIEAKVMKTSDSMACEYKLFTHDIIVFRDAKNMDMKVQIHTSYMSSPIVLNTI